MRAWFPDDAACLDYLDWLRWPDGFCCPHCGCVVSWEMRGGVRRCGGCRRRVSSTAGTVFHDTRTPLTVWFAAAWYMTTAKNGVSAVELKKLLGLGSYQTAWAMPHRYRVAMGLTGYDLLTGRVEVDETFVGGEKAGPGGRGALGKELVAVAVELRDPRGFGRVRLRVIPDASTGSLRDFLRATVTPGATVVTDGWQPYRRALAGTWTHEPYPILGSGLHARRAAACRPPGRVPVQAVVARHTPGVGRTRPPAGVPGRVHLPVQPARRSPARPAVLPSPPVRSRRARGELPVPRCELQAEAGPPGWCPRVQVLTGHPGPAGRRSALASDQQLRLKPQHGGAVKWIPPSRFYSLRSATSPTVATLDRG